MPGDKLLYLCTHSDRIPGIVPSIQVKDLLIGLIVAVIAKLLMWEKQQNSKKFRKGVEYGSARWGDKDEIKPYMSENPWLNIPLTATESITMESDQRIRSTPEIKIFWLLVAQDQEKQDFL